MTNFKSGSGNLDFGGDSDESASAADEAVTAGSTTEPPADEQDTAPADDPAAGTDGDDTAVGTASSATARETYPYFVRRNNVGDERDTRLEIHVRDKVADREAQFRHALADRLGASDVSKTDAREFALLAAFEHPEKVAQLMREEGFDTLG